MPTWASEFPGWRRITGVGLACFLILAMTHGMTGCAWKKTGPGNHPKTYLLVQKMADADIDEDFLDKIDSVPPPFPEGGVYQIGDIPIRAGGFEVYKFAAEYIGPTSQGERLLHDLLIIKTDRQRRILDAVHYTLDWTDSPSLDLYRFRSGGLTLKEGLRVRELKLINHSTGKTLQDQGIISFKNL